MFAQIFPCLPYLETLTFVAKTKVVSRKAKIFPIKFRNIWSNTLSPFTDAGKTIWHTETMVREIEIWKISLRNNVPQFVPGFNSFKGYLYKLLGKHLIESTSFPGSSLFRGKDPGNSWSRGFQKIDCLRGVGKVSYYMPPLPHFTLRSQGVSILYNQLWESHIRQNTC
jgi:hypothetical protein